MRGLIYAVQFEADPANGVERALDRVVHSRAMDASPAEYLAAVRAALQSDEYLSALIPQRHSEAGLRAYLAEIQLRLEGEV